MVHVALSSAAFIGSDADTVIKAAVRAGAEGIEWTDDGFIAPGDSVTAQRRMMDTLEAGLCTVSYAALFRAGLHDISAFDTALATAQELHAPVLRLWTDFRTASLAADKKRFYDVAKRIGDKASRTGVTVCFGIAPRSILSSCNAAQEIFSELDHPFVKLAWTPQSGASFDTLVESCDNLGGKINLFLLRYDHIHDEPESCSEDWYYYLDIYNEQSGDPDMARHVIIRSRPPELEQLRVRVHALKAWGQTLRRYHRRRLYT